MGGEHGQEGEGRGRTMSWENRKCPANLSTPQRSRQATQINHYHSAGASARWYCTAYHTVCNRGILWRHTE